MLLLRARSDTVLTVGLDSLASSPIFSPPSSSEASLAGSSMRRRCAMAIVKIFCWQSHQSCALSEDLCAGTQQTSFTHLISSLWPVSWSTAMAIPSCSLHVNPFFTCTSGGNRAPTSSLFFVFVSGSQLEYLFHRFRFFGKKAYAHDQLGYVSQRGMI
jgi:hypothetical protein